MPKTSTDPSLGKRKDICFRIEDHVGHMFRRAYQRATANLHEHIAEFELTALQFATLARLAEQGPLSQNRLGRLVDMEPANIHGLVRRLLKRGLVIAQADDTDRRQLLISLSKEGRDLFERALGPSEVANRKTTERLSADEHNELYRLLEKVADRR